MDGIEIEAECEGETVAIWCRRPRWEDVYDGYPLVNRGVSYEEDDLPAEQVFKSILKDDYYKKNKGTFKDACATRVSIALIKAGMKITKGKEFNIQIGDLKGEGFIASAINLLKWLSKSEQFGEADIIIKNPSSLAYVNSQIGDKKGIYILESNNYKIASGHATLWYNGDAIGGNHHYKLAKEINFWELK